MIITIERETLSDNSVVCNVLLSDGATTIAFHALDETHAINLAEYLGQLIVTHTCD